MLMRSPLCGAIIHAKVAGSDYHLENKRINIYHNVWYATSGARGLGASQHWEPSMRRPPESDVRAAAYHIMGIMQRYSAEPQTFSIETNLAFGAPPLHLTTFRAFSFRCSVEEFFGLPDESLGGFSVRKKTVRGLALQIVNMRRKLMVDTKLAA